MPIYPYNSIVEYVDDDGYQDCICNLIDSYDMWQNIIDEIIEKTKNTNISVLYEKIKLKHTFVMYDANAIIILMSFDYFIYFHKCLHAIYNNLEYDEIYNILLQKII